MCARLVVCLRIALRVDGELTLYQQVCVMNEGKRLCCLLAYKYELLNIFYPIQLHQRERRGCVCVRKWSRLGERLWGGFVVEITGLFEHYKTNILDISYV